MAAVMAMKTRPITPAFGVEVLDVELPKLTDAAFDELHGLWKASGILLVRGQQAMTDAQFEAFSKRFGELDPPPNQGVGRKGVPGFPNLYVVSNEKDSRARRWARSATAKRCGIPT